HTCRRLSFVSRPSSSSHSSLLPRLLVAGGRGNSWGRSLLHAFCGVVFWFLLAVFWFLFIVVAVDC
ncbi:hypothetical protein S83_038276, partial [Arachis hypogaea]